MYSNYFGLSEKPFAIAPDPRYLFMSDPHREALAHLMYGINSDGCIILLTGDVGTGKTTVCRCLFGQIPVNTDIAAILNPKLTILELLQTICEEFGIDISDVPQSVKEYTDRLNHYLFESNARGRISVVVIDEAQNLSPEVIEQLRLLTNLETNTHKLLKIILIGQPELRDMLSLPTLAQVNQRITTRYHLKPLQVNQLKTYIEHRISVAGPQQHQIFSNAAIRYIGKKAQGIPRLINVICDRAMLGAYASNSPMVTRKIARLAAHEVIPPTSQSRRSKSKWFWFSASFAVLLFISVTLYISQDKSWPETRMHLQSLVPFFSNGESQSQATVGSSADMQQELPAGRQ